MSVAIRAVCGVLLMAVLGIAPADAAPKLSAHATSAPSRKSSKDSSAKKSAESARESSPESPPGPSPASPSDSSSESSEAAWTHAMTLSDEQRYDEALTVIRKALDRDPASTELLWLEAGVLGWSGRHEESVAHYEGLIANHPELADRVRVDLGAQRLWAGDPRGALRDAEAELAKNPFNEKARRLRALALARSDKYRDALEAYDRLLSKSPDDVELQLDRATVLGWMGKNEEAVEAYAHILDEHPQELRARIGLAQNENWRGNHRRAAHMFELLIEEGHEDPEVLTGLAYANYWDDQPQAARRALDRLTAIRPQDRDASKLSSLLRFEEDPTLTGGFEASDDSDDLRVHTLTLDCRFPLPGRSALMLFVRDDHVRDPDGTEDPFRVGAGLEKRWHDRWKAAVRAFYFDPRNDLSKRVMGEASVSYRPDSRSQYELGVEVEPVLTRRSLALGIRTTNGNAAASWKIVDRITVSAAAQYRDYSDDNRATLASSEVRWELPSRRKGRIALLFGADLLRTAKDLDNGYYDPERYFKLGPGAEWTMEVSHRATLGLGARTGYQKEKGGAWDPFYKVEGHAEFPIGRALRLVIQAERGNSNLGSASGFERTSGSISLTTAF